MYNHPLAHATANQHLRRTRHGVWINFPSWRRFNAGHLRNLKLVQEKKIELRQNRPDDTREPIAVLTDDIRRRFHSGRARGAQHIRRRSAVAARFVEPIQQEQVTEVENSRRAAREIEMLRCQLRVGASTMEK